MVVAGRGGRLRNAFPASCTSQTLLLEGESPCPTVHSVSRMVSGLQAGWAGRVALVRFSEGICCAGLTLCCLRTVPTCGRGGAGTQEMGCTSRWHCGGGGGSSRFLFSRVSYRDSSGAFFGVSEGPELSLETDFCPSM